MQPSECRNFETCNAAVCPLAPTQGRHLADERVCVYALASGKIGAAERYAAFPEFAEVIRKLPIVIARFPSIGRAVDRAAKSPLPPDRSVYLARYRATKSSRRGLAAEASRPSTRPKAVSSTR
jgi:hypothetical protein